MSATPNPNRKKVTTHSLRAKKARGEPITMLTAYDFPTAQAIDQAGIDAILVGDSLGMVVQGYDTTLPVTMEDCSTTAGRRPRRATRPPRRRHAVHVLPGSRGRGRAQRRPASPGSRHGRRQARGRPPMCRHHQPPSSPPASRSWATSASPRSRVHQLGGFKVQGKRPRPPARPGGRRARARSRRLLRAGAGSASPPAGAS